VVALLIVVAAIGVASWDASASGTLPRLPAFIGASAADNGLQVSPQKHLRRRRHRLSRRRQRARHEFRHPVGKVGEGRGQAS
jgi:hypothetical protein